MMPIVAILCGGRGTRIARGEDDLPKPLVLVGGRPILWHVMALYAVQGFTRFLLLTGWQSARVERAIQSFDQVIDGDWSVTLLDTGEDTPTGGRVAQARSLLESETFALTYADGVADIDLNAELAFHRSEQALATIAVTRPSSPWGEVRIDDQDRITGFVEKPKLDEWINGGFMFMEPGAFAFIGSEDVLERGPLEELASAGELRAYRHEGFWDCMDTYKDTLELNQLCADGTPPWLKIAASTGGGDAR